MKNLHFYKFFIFLDLLQNKNNVLLEYDISS